MVWVPKTNPIGTHKPSANQCGNLIPLPAPSLVFHQSTISASPALSVITRYRQRIDTRKNPIPSCWWVRNSKQPPGMKRSLLTNGDNLPTSTGAVFDGSKPLITCQEKQTPPELKIETCAEFRSSNHEWNNIAIHPKLLPNPNFLRENRAFLLGIELGMVETLFESWRVPAPGWDRYGVVQFWIWIASYFLIQISWIFIKILWIFVDS